jgi:glycosyltransferase involved in cell wall biosynthesis
MNILYAGHMPDKAVTGGEKRLAEVLEHLSRAGEDVSYLETETTPRRFIKRNFLLTNLWYFFKLATTRNRAGTIVIQDYSRRFYLFIFNILISIFFNGKVKLVCTVNAFYFDSRKSRTKNIIDNIVSRIIFRTADSIIAGGRAAAEKTAAMDAKREKIKTVYPALRPEFSQHRQARSSHQDRSPVKLLFVGRVNPVKGLQYLLDACALLGETKYSLTIIGDTMAVPQYFSKIKKQIESLGLGGHVEFTGRIDSAPALLQRYREADVLVLPSLWETSPSVLVEAMCAGLPIVSTAVGGTPEYVKDGVNGILVPSRSPKAIAKALGKIIRDPELRERLGRAGHKLSFEYRERTWNDVGKEYRNHLRMLVQPNTKSVVLFTNSCLPQVGGLEIAIDNLSRELMAQGRNVTIIAGTNRIAFSKEISSSGITVYRLPFVVPRLVTGAGHGKLILSIVKSLLSPVLMPMSLMKTIQILRRINPAVVNLHYIAENALYCLASRRFVPFKLIVSIHGSDIEKHFDRPILARCLTRRVLNSADRVLSNSVYLLRKGREISPSLDGKSRVVQNGVSDLDFENVSGGVHPRKYLLAIGSLVPNKGIDVLVRAFGLVHQSRPELDLVVAGEGHERVKYVALAEKLGLGRRIEFTGTVERSGIASLIRGCEFLVSASRNEAFGISILEAMTAGKAVVATAVGGVPEIVTNMETGLLVAPDSPEEMARAILLLLNDDQLRQALGKRGRDAAREFSWHRISDRYIHEYEEVLGC